MHLPLQGRFRGLEVEEGGRVAASGEGTEGVVAVADDGGRPFATERGQLASLRQEHGEEDEERRGQQTVGQPGLAVVLAAGRERADRAGDPDRQREADRQADEGRLAIIVPDAARPHRQTGHCHQQHSGIPVECSATIVGPEFPSTPE